jgi:hypothetical protein
MQRETPSAPVWQTITKFVFAFIFACLSFLRIGLGIDLAVESHPRCSAHDITFNAFGAVTNVIAGGVVIGLFVEHKPGRDFVFKLDIAGVCVILSESY